MSVNAPVQIDRQRIRELIEREEKRLNEATPKSAETYKRAHDVLSGGVASSYPLRDPWPIYLERGDGPRVTRTDKFCDAGLSTPLPLSDFGRVGAGIWSNRRAAC